MTPPPAPITSRRWPWSGRSRFVLLASGPRAAAELLAAWSAWRDDAERSARLSLIWIATDLPGAADGVRSLAVSIGSLTAELLAAWPPATPNLHALSFDDARVEWLLAPGDVAAWLTELSAGIDAFVFDDDPAERSPRFFKAVARLANAGAIVTLGAASSPDREALVAAGFVVDVESPARGSIGAPTTARFAPRYTPRRAVGHAGSPAPAGSRAVIVGAGLAGCASAWALSEYGVRCTVLERRNDAAREASGNPAGLFHGVVHAHDGHHARFNRAAALEARKAVRIAIESHAVAGAVDGLLRLESTLDVASMRALLSRLQLPADCVEALDAETASARAGLALASPAWFYPGGGWVDPAGLARSFIERAGALAEWRCGVDVQRLEPLAGGRGGWRLFDAQDRLVDEAAIVILANATDALRLLGSAPGPLAAVRGQLSFIDASAIAGALPRLPLAGAGYLLPPVGGMAVFGATAQAGDVDGSLRLADSRANLAQVERLLGRAAGVGAEALGGRTAWRCVSGDRLLWVGAAPLALTSMDPARPAPDQPRHVPRRAGLFLHTALGSRGITWAALGARVLAAIIAGAPVPLEASLRDAIDPARFQARAARARRAGLDQPAG